MNPASAAVGGAAQARAHLYYVALEAVKVLALLALGCVLLGRI
ncbi:hypothetical protein [Microbispora sp. KK1-11]|nr:hypothetical protein [Microbispora sp. KK1-11]